MFFSPTVRIQLQLFLTQGQVLPPPTILMTSSNLQYRATVSGFTADGLEIAFIRQISWTFVASLQMDIMCQTEKQDYSALSVFAKKAK